ncbi:pre-mRNA-splicing factor ATP-dependent RNA helicase DEAH10-like [Cicer arietinum]|uniref:pre-mRNA-splicing factor ATP-dependent RNA helicase DEAH10-like n=1 Tax=Cicer arietinum TaxID=3827 RepID=UPI000641623A
MASELPSVHLFFGAAIRRPFVYLCIIYISLDTRMPLCYFTYSQSSLRYMYASLFLIVNGFMSLDKDNGHNDSFLKKDHHDKSSPLKVIIMSASLDACTFSEYFGGAKAVHIQGRQFPVDIFYTRHAETDYLDAALITIFQVHLGEAPVIY